MLKKLLVGVAFGALAGGAASAATWEEINNAGSQSRDWLVYGGDLGQMRYLPMIRSTSATSRSCG